MKMQIIAIDKPGGSHNINTHIIAVDVVNEQEPIFHYAQVGPNLSDICVGVNSCRMQIEDVIRALDAGTRFYTTDKHGNKTHTEAYPSLEASLQFIRKSVSPTRRHIRTKLTDSRTENFLFLPNTLFN